MPAERTVPVAILRAAVAQHVEQSSLRKVARDIGMSASGLFSFLRSADRRAPQARTHRKLVDWFVRIGSREAPGPTTDTIEAGVSVLVQYLPAEQRAAAVREILNVIDAHSGTDKPPRWLRDLRARYPEPRRRGRPRK